MSLVWRENRCSSIRAARATCSNPTGTSSLLLRSCPQEIKNAHADDENNRNAYSFPQESCPVEIGRRRINRKRGTPFLKIPKHARQAIACDSYRRQQQTPTHAIAYRSPARFRHPLNFRLTVQVLY